MGKPRLAQLLLPAVGLLLLGSCGGPGAFQCAEDEQCGAGRCEPTQYCSFPDSDCASGWAYGGDAPVGFADECTPPPGQDPETGTSTSDATTGTKTTQTTGSTTTTSTTSATTDGTTGETTADATTEATGLPECADGLPGPVVCFDAAPQDWLGPVFPIEYDQDFAGCPIDAPIEQGVHVIEALAAPAVCTCACTSDQGCTGTVESFPDPGCEGSPDQTVPFPADGECTTQPLFSSSIRYSGSLAACEGNESEMMPPIAIDGLALCATSSSATCEGRTCFGGGQRSEACIYRPGEHECPSSFDDERRLVHQTVVDSRACDTCSCTSGQSCELRIHVTSGCSASLDNTVVFQSSGQCDDLSGGHPTFESVPLACEASGGGPVGAVDLDEPLTVCCADRQRP